MKQQPFERKYQQEWDCFAQALANNKIDENFPTAYRRICHHLAIARSRNYSLSLCQKLNRLAIAGHEILYTNQLPWYVNAWSFLINHFPATLYRNRLYIAVAFLLFFVPLLVTALTVYYNDEFILSIMSAEQVIAYENMYDPMGNHAGDIRPTEHDLAMFGFYIKNNIGIAFQTFAGGIFAGLGSITALLFNGVMIGATAGHLTRLGFGETFYPFVATHSALELTAIALAGAAGLRLGFALLAPGIFTRKQALTLAGSDAIQIILGVTVMLLLAALIEAFWSSSSLIPAEVKLTVAAVLWALIGLYAWRCLRKASP